MRRRFHYYSHRGHRKHPTTLVGHLGRGLVLPLLFVVLAASAVTGAIFAPETYTSHLEILFAALGTSLVRLLVAYVLAILIGIPLALLAESNRKLESVLLPIYDVMESLPVLAFFPIIIIFFIHSGWLEGAAVFIIFFSMIWNITFNTIGGIRQTPADVKAVGKVFGLSRLERFFQITLPALFPPLVTASILAMADGWNILIVAEALHAYVPVGTNATDLFGIGGILVNASVTSNTTLLVSAICVLVVAIACINLLVWQPLLAQTERFKFE